MNSKKLPIIGITLGEATGIGPELTAKLFARPDIVNMARFVLMGDRRVLAWGEKVAQTSVACKVIKKSEDIVFSAGDLLFLDLENLDCEKAELETGKYSAESGQATGNTLQFALRLAVENKLDAIVYAPLNKDALHKGGFPFKDEIHLFASLLNWKGVFSEINIINDLWFTRVTSHIPLKDVCANITRDSVLGTIRFTNQSLSSAGIASPRIAVSALNPHAGDNGLFGTEEIESIIPAIKIAQEEGIDASGPYPADTIFLKMKNNQFHALVSMYHDQGQTGIKLLGFEQSVTVSGGLPVIVTTPAHGSAFDIAGKGVADSGAMEEAVKLAYTMASKR